jgi:hypothetical protein
MSFISNLHDLVCSINGNLQDLLKSIFTTGFHVDSNSARIQIGNTSPLTLSSNTISVSAPSSSFSVSSKNRSESTTATSSYTSTKTIPSSFSDTIVVDGIGTFQLVPIILNGNIRSMSYVLKTQVDTVNNYYTNSTPVLAILNYTYGFEKRDGSEFYVGNIHFQEVTITTDPFKNRLWHFRWGGEIIANKFNTVFQFNPTTTIPIGGENVLITQINFDSDFYVGKQEYIQGFITVNNYTINVSYMRKVLDFTWDAANAEMTLSFDLTKWDPNWQKLLNWINVSKDFDPSTYKDERTTLLAPNGTNSIHVQMSIRDGSGKNII